MASAIGYPASRRTRADSRRDLQAEQERPRYSGSVPPRIRLSNPGCARLNGGTASPGSARAIISTIAHGTTRNRASHAHGTPRPALGQLSRREQDPGLGSPGHVTLAPSAPVPPTSVLQRLASRAPGFRRRGGPCASASRPNRRDRRRRRRPNSARPWSRGARARAGSPAGNGARRNVCAVLPRRRGRVTPVGAHSSRTMAGRTFAAPRNSATKRLFGSWSTFARWTDLREPPIPHHADARRHGQRLFLVVGHQDEGDAQAALQPDQFVSRLLAKIGSSADTAHPAAAAPAAVRPSWWSTTRPTTSTPSASTSGGHFRS